MKKLDWYILKKFYSTFFFIIMLMVMVSLVIDYSERADDFVKAKKGFYQVLTQYYIGFIPHLISLLFHLFVFIAVIFFTSKMANKTEVIPILASGTTYNRFLRPYLLGSSILALLLWWASNGFIPRSNKLQTDFRARYMDGSTKVNHSEGNYYAKYLKIDSNTFAGIKQYDTGSKSGQQFFYHSIKNNRISKNVRSTSFRWDTSFKNTWRMDNVMERTLTNQSSRDSFFSFRNKKFNFKPEDIRNDDYIKDKLTTKELKRFIELEKKRGSKNVPKLEVELYRRGATAFAVVVLTLIGVFIASRKTRGGIGLQLALGVVLAIFYILFDKFSSVFASSGKIPPSFAVWIPNIIFSAIAIWLYKKAQK